jgi:hypothetical protein
MRKAAALLVIGLAALAFGAPGTPACAQDQASVESVVVTAPRMRTPEIIDHFVMAHATRAPALGKLTRWKLGICPQTTGLPPAFAKLVTDRVRQVAAMAGAPLADGPSCRVNIEIVFTREPQVLVDGVRKDKPELLGFYPRARLDEIARMDHPIKAWYATQTEDYNGIVRTDDPRPTGMTFLMTGESGGTSQLTPSGPSMTDVTLDIGYARKTHVRGDRLGDGLRSELYHVMVVADRGKVAGLEIGSIADYIAMLALSQTGTFDACEGAPSITNLLSPDCESGVKTDALTDVDLAFLSGLYKMNLAGNFQQQRAAIAGAMKTALDAQ